MTGVTSEDVKNPGTRAISGAIALDGVWEGRRRLEPSELVELPLAARRYLLHAIELGTVLATSVKLQLRGEIKLGKWRPFTAMQIMHHTHEFVRRTRTGISGIPISGKEQLDAVRGTARWSALGAVPLAWDSGPRITRSLQSRAVAEAVWLPSALCAPGVVWTGLTERNPHAYVPTHGDCPALEMTIEDNGRLRSFSIMRWAHLLGEGYHYFPFGGVAEDEATFQGYTIPTRIRFGYFVGTPLFESEGEFLRVRVDSATFI